MKNKKFFSDNLIKWDGNENIREMPWKGEKDPYKIWISEIMLQQTRVAQGREYYNRFVRAFPDIRSLASAPEEEVFKLWEGLGYYSRCRNLMATAKYLHEKRGGKFPDTFEEILQLKGIGNYTASAIASFAFNQPYAVLDGNVFRVLARFFGIDTPVDSLQGKRLFATLAQELIDPQSPARYNQAIMDFGADICKPSQPLCGRCPLKAKCLAFRDTKAHVLPVKTRRVRQSERFFNYLIIRKGKGIFLRKRTQKDIWQNLYEPVLVETSRLLEPGDLIRSAEFSSLLGARGFRIEEISTLYTQKLTHQRISGRFFHIELSIFPSFLGTYELLETQEIARKAFPKIIAAYFKEKKYL